MSVNLRLTSVSFCYGSVSHFLKYIYSISIENHLLEKVLKTANTYKHNPTIIVPL